MLSCCPSCANSLKHEPTPSTRVCRRRDMAMNPKPRPNDRIYLEVLAKMTPEQRLLKAFELSDFTRALFEEGLRKRFPDATEDELRRILLERLAKCHNNNY